MAIALFGLPSNAPLGLDVYPSGDVTGVTDATNLQGAINIMMASSNPKNRFLQLWSGQYYINVLLTALYPVNLNPYPIEIRGQGQTTITQVTNGIGHIEFQIPDGTNGTVFSAIGISITNMSLLYATQQSAITYPNLTSIGFRGVTNPATAHATIEQIYIDKIRFFNCVREIGNTQPAGSFGVWGVHITNCFSNNGAGAHAWIASPVTIGNPNINIDHFLTAQPQQSIQGGTDPQFYINGCDNLVLKNIEVLGNTGNLPVFSLASIGCFTIDGCKSEANTYSSSTSGVKTNSVILTTNATGTINSFRLNGVTLNTNGTHYPQLLYTSSACNIVVNAVSYSVTAGTGKMYHASGSGNVTWVNQPYIATLGSGPAIISGYDSTTYPADAGGVLFLTYAQTAGPISPDMGDASSTWYGLAVAGSTGGYGIEIWNTPLTANRTKTLTTAAGPILDTIWQGATTRTIRTAAATGASTLTVGSKVLAPGQWVDHTYQGATLGWVETASGSL